MPHHNSCMNIKAPAWHTLSAREVCDCFGTDSATGLSAAEARKRLVQFGPNRLREKKRESLWDTFLEEIREPMVLLLLVTGILYSIWGNMTDAITIFAVIITLAGIEVFNEHRAGRAIAALQKLSEPTAAACREGHYIEIPAGEVVPGDVLQLQAGRIVPADARLLEAYSLAVDESSLTGESLPVEKETALTLPENTPLAERRNLVFARTLVTRGRGTAIVVATGMATELGRVASMAQAVKEPRTPLQQSMRELTRWLIWLALGFSVIVPVLGLLLSHQSLQQMLLTGLSLAFATIPEEMPIIITMVLALGAYRLSRQKAIAKRLRAVETLGAVTVIATDKTGTLTENRMQVTRFFPEEMSHTLLELGVLCSDATENKGQFSGDPLETALLRAARDAGIDVQALRCKHRLRDEFTFDTLRKRMSVVYEHGDELRVAVKGSPESILANSTQQRVGASAQALTEAHRQAILSTATRMAAGGLRVIAFAEKMMPNERLAQDEAESKLTFIGLVGLLDPPRADVKESIAACRTAGLRPVMVTGDHPSTARAIAREIGLDGNAGLLTGPELDALSDEALGEAVGHTTLYARTTPEHKLRIVQALHARGERVAVTGDGTNDAPALAAADIGVAMGETGTDVAREAADIVLADDNFTTIVRAVAEGRVLFANLKKGVRYYLACKVALIAATLLPVLLLVPVPFAPIQIILMELFMDLAAAATFVAAPAESDLMHQPPRNPKAPFMDRAMITSIFTSAAGLFAAVSITYLLTWYTGRDIERAQTAAFVTWLLGHVYLAMNMHSEREPLFRLGLFSNRLIIWWAAATVAFILFIMLVPWVHAALRIVSLSLKEWALIIGVVFICISWIEVHKLLLFKRGRNK